MFNKKVNQKGQTLIEVALSMAIAVIVITGLSILAANALKSAQEVLRRSESGKFANAGIEAVTYYKNSMGINQFEADGLNTDTTPLCYELNANIGGGGGTVLDNEVDCPNETDGWQTIVSPTTGLTYSRKVSVTNISGDYSKLLAKTIIQWVDTQGDREVSVSRIITDWR